jgi:ceramide glucosyltransferase
MSPLASQAVAVAALAWACVSGWLAIGSVVRRRRHERNGRAFEVPPLRDVRVLLIRPCAGQEADLDHCLSSTRTTKRSFRLDVAFGVSEPDDPAVPVIERAIQTLKKNHIEARLFVIPPAGPNRKASTLAGIASETEGDYDVIINADSNVDLTDYDLDQLVGRIIADPKAGMVWCPFREYADRPSLGSRASIAVMGGALTSFTLLSSLSARSLSGKFWGVSVDRLDAAGGLARLVDFLGEDFELEQRFHDAGFHPVAVPAPARARAPELSLVDAINRISRWMLVVRAQRARLLVVYPSLFAGTPLNVLLALFALDAHPHLAIPAIALAVGARLLVSSAGAIYSGRGWDPVKMVVDAALSDFVILAAWFRTLFRRDVVWRGNVLRVGGDGRLRLIRTLPQS